MDVAREDQPNHGKDNASGGPDQVSENSKEDTSRYPTGLKMFSIGVGLCLAVICSNLDRSILGVAIPEITAEFHSLDDIGCIKCMFLGALGIFEIGSIVCAAAPNSHSLIVGRAIAGLGATGISTGALLIISHIMPVYQRPKYTAMIGACMGVTLVIAPFLGGVFTDHLSWRWCFWINLPLGGLTLLVVLLLVHLPNAPKRHITADQNILTKLDLPGTVLLPSSTVCLLLALQWGGNKYAWGSWRCILLFSVFGVCGLLWCYIQVRQGDAATVPMRLLKTRSILSSMWFAFCLFSMMFIQSYYVPIWFQALKDDSAYQAGINMLTITVAMTAAFAVTGILTTVTGYYVPSMISGSIISAISSGLMVKFNADTSTGYWIVSLILSGIGFGLGAQQCMMVPQTILKGEDIALGTSAIMFAEAISGAVFLAVCETLFEHTLIRELRNRAPSINPGEVLEHGAAGLQSAMSKLHSSRVVSEILDSYEMALRPVWIVALVLGSLSLVGAVFTEWVSVKTETRENKEKMEEKQGNGKLMTGAMSSRGGRRK